jgi:3-hydroxyisobutyrate dehydrogenase-like beta-hydroxyacid dehydrogenase
MLKDVRLCLDEAKGLNVPSAVMNTVLDQWETTNAEYGGDSDFTAIVKMIEKRAGVVVGKEKK